MLFARRRRRETMGPDLVRKEMSLSSESHALEEA
jgi:hypothetical protein